LTEEDMIPKIVIDVPMPISYINENLIRQLSVLEPFGKGNAKPVFAQKNLRVLKTGIYGKTQNTVKLQLMDESGTVMDGVYWGEAKEFAEFARSHGTISVTYYPKINSYMGRDSLQIVIQNYC
jgi:single-stranded-DNA-specific exonuclease